MLARLEYALNCPSLTKRMVLQPKAGAMSVLPKEVNLVVGYNGSAKSQTALDLTLWIAYQTRLVTQKAVTVQVVYVVDEANDRSIPSGYFPVNLSAIDVHPYLTLGNGEHLEPIERVVQRELSLRQPSTAVAQLPEPNRSSDWQTQQFEKADRILWQARNLANEWRGSLETHLRFGSTAAELNAVARQVDTTALVLGCSSVTHAIVQALGQNLPFPILGIPDLLDS